MLITGRSRPRMHHPPMAGCAHGVVWCMRHGWLCVGANERLNAHTAIEGSTPVIGALAKV